MISDHRRISRRELARFLALGASAVVFTTASVLLAQPAHADSFTVLNTSDSGAGSLRQAILDANANPGPDRIEFDLTDTENDNPVTGAEIISPSAELPIITGPVNIDSYSQPGARETTRSTGAIDAIIQVELNGFNVERGSGLSIQTSNVVVRGLAINRFPGHGVEIDSGSGVKIEGNLIGTDSTGTSTAATPAWACGSTAEVTTP